MPRKETIARAQRDRREGKSPSTQAGEFVREEIDKIRGGEHGARSTRQAVAIGLSEARSAGVPLRPPRKGRVKRRTRKSAQYADKVGQSKRKPRRRPRVSRVLKREPRSSVSHRALSRQAKRLARHRGRAARSDTARKAARTKGRAGRPAAARKLPAPGATAARPMAGPIPVRATLKSTCG